MKEKEKMTKKHTESVHICLNCGQRLWEYRWWFLKCPHCGHEYRKKWVLKVRKKPYILRIM